MRLPSVKFLFAFFAAVFCCVAQATSDLEVAKKALRDKLWNIARNRAEKAEGDEAKLIVLESYAREGKWDEILKCLGTWVLPPEDTFRFYRALVKVKTAGDKDVGALIENFTFKDPEYAKSLANLCAQIELKSGDVKGAARIVEKYSLAASGPDDKVIAAEVFKASGDTAGAERLWREVVANTNAGDKAFVLAAWGLGDAPVLSNAYLRVEESADLRRLVGLKLGTVLLTSPGHFAEGKKLITSLVNDSPGTDGAREAFVFLAGKCLENGDVEEAAKFYQSAMEAWPAAARDYAVHEGRGWSLLKLNKPADALLSFSRAEECASNDVDKATAVLMQGDILSTLGRGDESMAKYRIVLSNYPATPAGVKLKKIVELKDMESRGRDLFHDFRFAEAIEVFAEITKRDPASKPRMDYLEMLCLYGQGKDEQASSKAKALAANCPDATIKAEATLWLAKFLYNAGQWPESCSLFVNYATNMTPRSAQAPSALLWASRASFAGNDLKGAIDLVTRLAKDYPEAAEKPVAYVLQGEALIGMSRFDEAIVVFNTAAADSRISPKDRIRARMLKADALFVMGADNPMRYEEALGDYRALYMGETFGSGEKINLSFKIARTLEKLGKLDQALDNYYGEVVVAYRDARSRGEVLDEEVKANFARAAFRLVEEYESRGQDEKAKNILRLVIRSDVKPAVNEARRKLQRIKEKGSF